MNRFCTDSVLKFGLAEECLSAAQDLEGLLLLYVSTGHNVGIERLAAIANEQGYYSVHNVKLNPLLMQLQNLKGKNNVAFVCYFLLRRLDDCIDLLCNTGRIPEAAFFSRTYLPRYDNVAFLFQQTIFLTVDTVKFHELLSFGEKTFKH